MSGITMKCVKGVWITSCMWRGERIEATGDSIGIALMGLQVAMSDEIVLEGGVDA